MNFSKEFVPSIPFPDFKWQWASLQCTEGLNDPVVLLGVLFRMRKLEGKFRFNSEEFSVEMEKLQQDVSSTNVSLATRTGERNIIRNSGQYWKAVGLLDPDTRGLIKLTQLGRKIADREISQSEFAAITIQTLTLPNPIIMPPSLVEAWNNANISLHPLRLILEILLLLTIVNSREAYLTTNELVRIIVPLSAIPNLPTEIYVDYLLWFRSDELDLSRWPDCAQGANDKRIAREFLLFLENYGFVRNLDTYNFQTDRFDWKYRIEKSLFVEISNMLELPYKKDILDAVRNSGIIAEIERKRILSSRLARPRQSAFRKEVLSYFKNTCPLTQVAMPEVLEAAHIRPVKYNGNDTLANGFCLRLDMHQLFDTGHLRISPEGEILLSRRAEIEYSSLIPKRIDIPPCIDTNHLRWRWENYDGI